MRDWRKALQSKAMRNVTLAIFLANVAGIYAVQVRMNQSMADGLDAVEDAPPALADREIGADLPALPSPAKTAPQPAAVSPARLAAALAHFTPDTHFVPDARARALVTEPPEPEFAAVVQDAGPEAVQVAAVGPRAIARAASSSFTAAFAGMDAAAPAASADPAAATVAAPTGPSTPTGAGTVHWDPTASQPPAIDAVPQGQGGGELPALDDHAGTAGAVPAPATSGAPSAPAPSAGTADAPKVVLGA